MESEVSAEVWAEWTTYYRAQRALDQDPNLEAIEYLAGECPHPRTYTAQSCLREPRSATEAQRAA